MLVLCVSQGLSQSQDGTNSLADWFTLDERISGGLRSVMDRVYSLDKTHTSCGKRQMCEAMAELYIECSDGQFDFHRGLWKDN